MYEVKFEFSRQVMRGKYREEITRGICSYSLKTSSTLHMIWFLRKWREEIPNGNSRNSKVTSKTLREIENSRWGQSLNCISEGKSRVLLCCAQRKFSSIYEKSSFEAWCLGASLNISWEHKRFWVVLENFN